MAISLQNHENRIAVLEKKSTTAHSIRRLLNSNTQTGLTEKQITLLSPIQDDDILVIDFNIEDGFSNNVRQTSSIPATAFKSGHNIFYTDSFQGLVVKFINDTTISMKAIENHKVGIQLITAVKY